MRSAGVPGTKSPLRRSDIRYFAVTVLSMSVLYHSQQVSLTFWRFFMLQQNPKRVMRQVPRAQERGEEIGDARPRRSIDPAPPVACCRFPVFCLNVPFIYLTKKSKIHNLNSGMGPEKRYQGEEKMPTLLWTGKISLPLKLLLNMGNIIAWITGNARDSSAMKERMKDGYSGAYSDYIHQYDELASFHYKKTSDALMQKTDCDGKEVADVGSGTGILSFMALEKGAKKVRCVDISGFMLEQCRGKSIAKGYADDVITFHEGDVERLPFPDAACDVVFANMVLGMVPNQPAAVAELARILRPGGTVALSTHGPAHYREAIEAGVRSLNLRYFLGHRFEYWPRDENEIKAFFMLAGLHDIQTTRMTWADEFENGGKAFDFFASSTGLWWHHRLPAEIRNRETERARAYFQRKRVTRITCDVVFASGTKK